MNADYCYCKDSEAEEIERGAWICLICEKEINPADISVGWVEDDAGERDWDTRENEATGN